MADFELTWLSRATTTDDLLFECDGVAYHGPERYFEDLSRQRVLERAGWTFWRCWGTNFYRNPDAALAELYSVLDNMGIEPIGGQSVGPSPLVEHREVWGLSEDRDEVGEDLGEVFIADDGDKADGLPAEETACTEEISAEETDEFLQSDTFQDPHSSGAPGHLPRAGLRREGGQVMADLPATAPKPDELRNARLTLQKTQQVTARILGVTHATYSRWEMGHCEPAPDRRERLWRFVHEAERLKEGECNEVDHQIQSTAGGRGLREENPVVDNTGPDVDRPMRMGAETPEAPRATIRADDTVVYCFTDKEDQIKTVQIVTSPNQPDMGIISANSPIARALIGAEVGDEVEVHLPTGVRTLRVLEIEKAQQVSER